MDDFSPLTPLEMKERIDRLRDSISGLEKDRREYQKELNKRDQKECEKFVGKCYKTNDKYFKIIGVPQIICTAATYYFGDNQLPAIIIEINGQTFDEIYEDTIYRITIDAKYREANNRRLFSNAVATEITEEEFNNFLNEKVKQASAHIATTERFVNR